MADFFTSIDRNAVFQATVAPYLVLDLGLRIRAVNGAYLAAAQRHRADLIGAHLCDVFPCGPGHDAQPLRDSLERVLRRKQRHHMPITRYDLRGADGRPVKRLWSAVNSPLRAYGGEMLGLLHHAEDVTALEPFLDGETTGAPALARMLAIAAVRERTAALDLRDEAENLQRAMQSRAAIEQAKGILMARNHCGPDEAFVRLRELSQSANVKLRDLAVSVVAHAEAQD